VTPRDDGGLPRLGTACRRGVGGSNVGGGGGAGDRRGGVPSGSVTPEPATGGGCPVGLGDSTGSDRRGAVPSSSTNPHRPEGGCPVGLKGSLSDTTPRVGGRRTRSPSKRPPQVPDPPHEGCTEGGDSGEEEGAWFLCCRLGV
jgi:hypothetical protein